MTCRECIELSGWIELCPLHSLVDRLAEAFRIYFNAASGFQSYGLAEYADAKKVLAEYDAAKKNNHE